MTAELIGKKATIVGYSETGSEVEGGPDFVAHVCLDLEDGRRVYFTAEYASDVWTITEEPA